MPIRGILFDLDGTLLDTAPDMGGALNELRAEHGRRPLPAFLIRHWVSNGAAALVRLGFVDAGPAEHERLRLRFLDLYAARLARDTALFPGGEVLVAALESAGTPWGIVTNKPGWLAEPLLAALGLDRRARSVVSGDTLAEKKPHPAPLLHAARALGVAAVDCAYVGDAERDMLAARSAGMCALVAAYGYIDPEEGYTDWPSDGVIASLDELLPWVDARGAAWPAEFQGAGPP